MEKKYWKSRGILSVWKSGDYDAINKPDKAREKGGGGDVVIDTSAAFESLRM